MSTAKNERLSTAKNPKARMFLSGAVNDLLEARSEHADVETAYNIVCKTSKSWDGRDRVLDLLRKRRNVLNDRIANAWAQLAQAVNALVRQDPEEAP